MCEQFLNDVPCTCRVCDPGASRLYVGAGYVLLPGQYHTGAHRIHVGSGAPASATSRGEQHVPSGGP